MHHAGRLGVVLLVVACGCRTTTVDTTPISDSGATYVPDSVWRTASPTAAGFDAARVDALRNDVNGGRYGAIDGVLIVRYGYLVLEHYKGWTREQAHTMQSVSKSVTSLLLGIAAQQHPTLTVDRSVLSAFQRYTSIANDGAEKRALTIRHLLTMRTNMDFWEDPYAGSPLDVLNRSTGDWVKYILDRPMLGAPGAVWSYNSGAAIVTCGLIHETTGEAVDAFARRELFAPLGIRNESWFRSPFDGLPHCGGGLNLRPVDLARIGYLVLRNGKWGDKQVVSPTWLSESTQPYTRGSPVFFSSFGSAYGYFWWLFPVTRGGSDTSVITASGSGGQWLFVAPSLDLVVAVVASNGAGLDLFYQGILPAIVH